MAVMVHMPKLRRPAQTRARWLPTAGLMGALLVTYAGWQLLGWPAGDRKMIGDLFFFPVGLAAGWTAFSASQRCKERPGLRWAWRLLAVASLVYLAGDVAQLLYELVGRMPYPSIADALYLFFYPCALVGLLCFPAGRHDRPAWARLSLDLGGDPARSVGGGHRGSPSPPDCRSRCSRPCPRSRRRPRPTRRRN